MFRRTFVLMIAVSLTTLSAGTVALAQRLGGACRGIERRGYVGLPKMYRLRVWSANRPSVWQRRGVPVFRTTASAYYYGGRTTRNKVLRGNYYCGRYRFNTVGRYAASYRRARQRPLLVRQGQKTPGVFTSTPTFSSRITYGDSYGWTKLAEGKPAEAMKVFLQQARRQPNYGMPKLGYAMAVAANGDLAAGAKILRYAVKKHPRTLERLSLSAKAKSALQSLAAKYRPNRDSGNSDAAYLIATLEKLQPKVATSRQTADLGELRIIPR